MCTFIHIHICMYIHIINIFRMDSTPIAAIDGDGIGCLSILAALVPHPRLQIGLKSSIVFNSLC
jgi:hypothetical protein